MQKNFFDRTAVLGFALSAIAAAIFLFMRGMLPAAGVLTSACWMFLNLFFLFRLLDMGVSTEKPRNPGRILVLTVLKFPVIYLAGYFILTNRYFPVSSILTGVTLFMIALGVTWMTGLNDQRTGVSGQESAARGQESVQKIIGLFFIFLIPVSCLLYAEPSFANNAHESHEAAAVHGESHGAGHGDSHGGGASLHTTNLLGLVSRYLPGDAAKMLSGVENIFFGSLVILILAGIFYAASRNIKLIPGRLQSACESVVEGLDGFVCGILGHEGRKYTPFLGTLFLYILTMNLIGLVPLMKSNTANSITLQGPVALPIPTTTVSLALIVFVTVQFIGIKKQGIVGYLDHMAGTPRDAFGWVMAPIMFPIHIIGEFAKPFSLTFRLFCNTMGGHILVAVFIGMGVASMFIPFQAPFLMFEIATSTIQAFVFTLLSTVYIAMMLPHGHDESHGEAHADSHESAHGAH